jgi:hypothetical protein
MLYCADIFECKMLLKVKKSASHAGSTRGIFAKSDPKIFTRNIFPTQREM